ncbi:MAG: relaxase domain-containing protein [Isosphaeraceae bacterium]|nr:relaxase domain-containing protein [Isosphaeraceae bacterium]
MMTVQALTHGKGDYYLALARDDYYTKGGEPRGRWLGEGARAIGLVGPVDRPEFRSLMRGFSPFTTDRLIQNTGDPNHQPGWDVCFSAAKSVSVLWAQAEPEVRREIQQAQDEAVKAALDYLQEAAAFTRRGHGGRTQEQAKLVVATFEHGTSRAQDPQLHTHCVIMNVGVRADGTTGTILSKPLYTHKMAAGAVYRAELSNQLERRLGVRLERRERWFEVQGVPESLVKEFSKRREQVERALAEAGVWGARMAAKLTLTTRPPKGHLPRGELLSAWQKVGRRHGFTAAEADALLMREGPRQDLAARVMSCIRAAAEKITRQESHFPERELVRRAAEEAQAMGVDSKLLRHMIKQELARSPEFVCLGRAGGEIRYTTSEMLALEKKMLDQVEALEKSPSPRLAEETIRSVEKSLSDEQKRALRHVTQSGGRVQIVSGLAGTGKSSMLRAAREAFERDGFEVIGACLSGKAAQGLEAGAGIKSSTLAKLLGMPEVGYRGELERGPLDTLKHHARQMGRAALGKSTWPAQPIRLTPKTVLVIDEAGMVGTRQMEQLTEKVLAAGARLVLVGDEKQLQAIDAGGPFRSLGERMGRATLTEIQRQREPWAREAVKQIACGEARAALKQYASRGLVSVADDRNEAIRTLITSWKRQGAMSPRDNLILASTNQDATALNRMAQTQRMLTGGLGKQALSAAGPDFHRGDRVLFTRNSKRYGVQNGSLGTVIEVDAPNQILTVKLDQGRLVLVPVKDYGHLKLGYALTTHKAQGATTENAYVLLGGPSQDRELSYVQASRARGTTRFFLDKLEAGEDLRALCKQLERSRQKDLSYDLL